MAWRQAWATRYPPINLQKVSLNLFTDYLDKIYSKKYIPLVRGIKKERVRI